MEELGQRGRNRFVGGGGDDRIWGRGGNDSLLGDHLRSFGRLFSGDDQLRRGLGADLLLGGARDDDLDGGPGSNRNDGGPGLDHCVRPSTARGAVAAKQPKARERILSLGNLTL